MTEELRDCTDSRLVQKFSLQSRCPRCGSNIQTIKDASFSLTEKNRDQQYLPIICGSCGYDLMQTNKKGILTVQSR